MKERIELRGNHFELESKINDEEFNEIYQKYCIHIIDNDNKTAKQIKFQILEDQEKANKKYHKLEKDAADYKRALKSFIDNNIELCTKVALATAKLDQITELYHDGDFNEKKWKKLKEILEL